MKARFALWLIFGAGVTVAAASGADSKTTGNHIEELVNALRGKWSITETTISAAGASGQTHSGTEQWYTATGGLTLIEENRTNLASGDAHDTALIWWDGKAQAIRGVWCADINAEGCSGFEVHRAGADIVMAGEWEDREGRHAWKETFVFAGPDVFTQTLSVGPPGGELARVAVIRGSRAQGGANGTAR